MRVFDYKKLEERKRNNDIIVKIAEVHEAKGRQEFYLSHKPEELERLVEIARIQSTEASNAIEGIRTTDTRLKQLINEKTTPKNRNEKEIAGYRDALAIIHENYDYISITPNYILQLHSVLYSHCEGINFGGKFKNVQNSINSFDESGKSYTIFTPLSPFETPIAIENLCNEYNKAIEKRNVDPLILIAVFIHDFLCIHPFSDGNGRMSRLLTLLLLYKCGYYVGKYISLEAKISKLKDLYYETLFESQKDWHDGKDDPSPFISYLLGVIAMAYQDFENRANLIIKKLPAYEMVEDVIKQRLGKITKSKVAELCPSLSLSAIEKVIAKMVEEGKLEKRGAGKSTYYIIKK